MEEALSLEPEKDLPWFESLRQMLKLIPSGFPVRIDVPLFYVLTARVTFQNINSLDGDGCSEGMLIYIWAAYKVLLPT